MADITVPNPRAPVVSGTGTAPSRPELERRTREQATSDTQTANDDETDQATDLLRQASSDTAALFARVAALEAELAFLGALLGDIAAIQTRLLAIEVQLEEN